jgi:WD40 repeat protein
VTAVAFSPTADLLATASMDHRACLWTFDGTQRMTLVGHTDGLTAVEFAPNGTMLATASHDNSVRLWDIRTGPALIGELPHDGPVNAVAFSPGGGTLLATASCGLFRLWDTSAQTELAKLVPLPGGGWAAFLPDGAYKLVGEPGGTVWWAVKNVRFEPGELDLWAPAVRRLDSDSRIALPETWAIAKVRDGEPPEHRPRGAWLRAFRRWT